MGVFKKFIGGLALESMQMNSEVGNFYTVIPYKTINGVAQTNIAYYNVTNWASTNRRTLVPYFNLTPVATADDISNYDINTYSITPVGTVTHSETVNIQSHYATRTFNVVVNNSSDDAIDVKCVKFKKYVYNGSTEVEVLICAYYLDSPLTIPAGESRTITIEMKVGTDVSVNET